MVIWPVLPSSLVVGVPVNAPVAESKAIQVGCPCTLNVTAPPADTVGWNLYALPAVTLAAGVPLSWTLAGWEEALLGVAVVEAGAAVETVDT